MVLNFTKDKRKKKNVFFIKVRGKKQTEKVVCHIFLKRIHVYGAEARPCRGEARPCCQSRIDSLISHGRGLTKQPNTRPCGN